jgi:hypothetical protein
LFTARLLVGLSTSPKRTCAPAQDTRTKPTPLLSCPLKTTPAVPGRASRIPSQVSNALLCECASAPCRSRSNLASDSWLLP